jgi:hypothetical protein
VGTGKLILHSACKAYGESVLIQVQTIMTSSNTEKDIIPPLFLDYDCCTSERKTTKLNDIHLDLPLRNIVKRPEDLTLASHKVEDVEKLISVQEWKIRQSPILPIIRRNGYHQPCHDYSLLFLFLLHML